MKKAYQIVERTVVQMTAAKYSRARAHALIRGQHGDGWKLVNEESVGAKIDGKTIELIEATFRRIR